MAEETFEKEEKLEEKVGEEQTLDPENLMAMWEEALKEAQASPETKPKEDYKAPIEIGEKVSVDTKPADLQELRPQKDQGHYPELDFILDIPLEIAVELGRSKMLIKDLLKLNQGSIIELEKFAGEPVEVYVNGRLMAKGEVVVVNDRFGVRVTEIISAQERIKRLGS
ncbi:MAG: flagellar motor switch protein FliN [Caldimicrobium sp.]